MLTAFRPLREYLTSNRWPIAFGLFSVVAVDTLQLLIPRIIKKVIDDLTVGKTSTEFIFHNACLIIIIAFLIVIFRFSWRYCIIGTSRRIEMGLRNRLFSQVVKLPVKDLIHSKTGDLMARMTNDIEAIRMCTGFGWVALVDTLYLGFAAIAFMLFISPRLTFMCVLPLSLVMFVTWRLSRLMHSRFAMVQRAFSLLTEKVRETIDGIAVIKAYAQENANLSDFNTTSNNYVLKNMALVKIMGLLFPLIIFFSNLSIGMLIFFGGRSTLSGAITTGDFVAFASYLWILSWPMMALGWVVNLFQRGKASMQRLNAILDLKTETLDDPAGFDTKIDGRIEIKDLSFSYNPGSGPTLNNITISARPGETIGITGTTGSGKTTLCNLLMRFYDPPPGTVFVDDCDILDQPLIKVRKNIAYVPQDSFLFSDTIQGNMTFGKLEATDAEIRDYAIKARILDEIMNFEDGFKTMIGEKGVTLSGGQKQRLCIARALLIQAPILILDDALSALDVDTTRELVTTLKAIDYRRTSVIVSNRIASIQDADMIYVFETGQIVESGTHRQLVKNGGLYHSLYLKQKVAEGS